ncbi:MAG: diaminopimelate epimerase [Clostridia bacterium]|nr:diaminopimelate epimerase [Clostridia bacterium]
MRYTKMHGIGNDYLFVFGEVPANAAQLAVKYSNRQSGIGSDGMIYINYSDIADFSMRIFNADGSEAKMCGNGIRCVARFVREKGYTDKDELTVETLSDVKHLLIDGGGVTVDMGKAEISDDLMLDLGFECTPVSVGNPHAVIFTDDVALILLRDIGPKIECNKAFPGRVNVEFVSVVGDNELRMRVWERGSGETLACGTGACASAAAAVSKGLCRKGEPIKVHLDGGDLEITVKNDFTCLMRGPAEFVSEGEIE